MGDDTTFDKVRLAAAQEKVRAIAAKKGRSDGNEEGTRQEGQGQTREASGRDAGGSSAEHPAVSRKVAVQVIQADALRMAASGRRLCVASDATSVPGLALVGIVVGDQSCVIAIDAIDYNAHKLLQIIHERHPD